MITTFNQNQIFKTIFTLFEKCWSSVIRVYAFKKIENGFNKLNAIHAGQKEDRKIVRKEIEIFEIIIYCILFSVHCQPHIAFGDNAIESHISSTKN